MRSDRKANHVFIAGAASRGGYMCDGDAMLIDNAIVGFHKRVAVGKPLALIHRKTCRRGAKVRRAWCDVVGPQRFDAVRLVVRRGPTS